MQQLSKKLNDEYDHEGAASFICKMRDYFYVSITFVSPVVWSGIKMRAFIGHRHLHWEVGDKDYQLLIVGYKLSLN